MDTISRENNSILPLGAAIVGGLALILGIVSLVSLQKVKATLAADQDKINQIDDIASQASAANAAADKVSKDVAMYAKQTQDAFTAVGNTIGGLQASITKLEEAAQRHSVHGSHGGAPAVAGPGEYIVRPGDTGRRIARSQGVSLHDLIEVNPDVDWKHLKVGQKIKLPEKQGT